MENRNVRGNIRPAKKWLLAWFNFQLNGSIGRFINIKKVLEKMGHRLAFMSLIDNRQTLWPDLQNQIITFAEACRETWDAVMIPGAGVSPDMLPKLGMLKEKKFGTRVQHILNDPSVTEKFKIANAIFAPEKIIFNNSHWQKGSFSLFKADSFHILPGAVDLKLFGRKAEVTFPQNSPCWIIGGYAAKNIAPVLAALERLPKNYILYLFGDICPENRDQISALEKKGRLQCFGFLFGENLADFYRRLDFFVAAETRAGWCNSAAEAMAMGIPSFVSSHGTIDFAVPGKNCIGIDPAKPEIIAQTIMTYSNDIALLQRISSQAKQAMKKFSWQSYVKKLLEIVVAPNVSNYYFLPERKLFGKWQVAARMRGVDFIAKEIKNKTLLDIGCAEGLISHSLYKNGQVRLIHGFDANAGKIAQAQKIFQRIKKITCCFRVGDIADWQTFSSQHSDVLLATYDVILCLGIYHHLPIEKRRSILENIADMAGEWLLVRTPKKIATDERLVEVLRGKRFTLVQADAGDESQNLGWLGIFKKSVK